MGTPASHGACPSQLSRSRWGPCPPPRPALWQPQRGASGLTSDHHPAHLPGPGHPLSLPSRPVFLASWWGRGEAASSWAGLGHLWAPALPLLRPRWQPGRDPPGRAHVSGPGRQEVLSATRPTFPFPQLHPTAPAEPHRRRWPSLASYIGAAVHCPWAVCTMHAQTHSHSHTLLHTHTDTHAHTHNIPWRCCWPIRRLPSTPGNGHLGHASLGDQGQVRGGERKCLWVFVSASFSPAAWESCGGITVAVANSV